MARHSVGHHLGLNSGIILAQNVMGDKLFQPKLMRNYEFAGRKWANLSISCSKRKYMNMTRYYQDYMVKCPDLSTCKLFGLGYKDQELHWLSGWLEIKGLWVWASPVALPRVLEQDTLSSAWYWFNPGRPIMAWLKFFDWDVKDRNKQTNKKQTNKRLIGDISGRQRDIDE